jgi:hypothetical protein
MFNLVDPIPDHGYEFPINSASNDPTKWEYIIIQ